jgi:hypothetical protein
MEIAIIHAPLTYLMYAKSAFCEAIHYDTLDEKITNMLSANYTNQEEE